MTHLRVAVDVQHAFRSGVRAGDRGARFTVAGLTVWETSYTLAYGRACALELAALDHLVLTNADGTVWGSRFVGPYSHRQQVARAWAADVYLACHVNAGGGTYGRVSWALDSSMRERSRAIATVLQEAIATWRGARVQAFALKPGDRGHVCVYAADVPLGAVLLEPFFGDDPAPPGLDAMPSLGRMLARALDEHARALKLGGILG